MTHSIKSYIDAYFTTLINCCEQNSFNEFDQYRVIVLDKFVRFDACTGLCNNLTSFAYDCGFILDSYELNTLFSKYPNFSGCIAYPIKGDLGHERSYDYFLRYRISLYNQKTEYGKERLEMIKFLYSELMKDYDKVFISRHWRVFGTHV